MKTYFEYAYTGSVFYFKRPNLIWNQVLIWIIDLKPILAKNDSMQ